MNLDKVREQSLTVEIVDGKLQISIGVDLLCHAVSVGLNWEIDPEDTTESTFRVVDVDTFSAEICRELEREEEDGSTRVHHMLDQAAEYAMEQGAQGIDEVPTPSPQEKEIG